MRIAVTGSTGFIGRHVLERLSIENVDVVCISRNDIKSNGSQEHIKLSLENVDQNIFEKLGRPDALLHLAWGGLPNYKSLHHINNELPMQYRFLRLMVEGGLSRIIGVGSCFEYGMQSGSLNELVATNPCNPYGFAKDVFRKQLEYLANQNNTKMIWARLFYMWGSGQYEGSLYSLMKAAAERGDKVFSMSMGEQLRDYLHVSYVADAIVRLTLDPSVEGVVNVCSGRPISIRRLAEEWVETYGWDLHLNFGDKPYLNYEPFAFWGDNSKLTQIVGHDYNSLIK
jgi:nucleoside-diphosphate-sugar epimerase